MKTFNQILFLCFLFHLCATPSNSQEPIFDWAKRMGGNNSDYGKSIATDASGNIYVTGYFRETVDFDPGLDTFNLISEGQDDIFIQKLDPNGNLIWAKQIGGAMEEYSYSIVVDNLGNTYTAGKYNGTVDFDPGPDTFNLISASGFTTFVQKLDHQGNFEWVKEITEEYTISLALDNLGNVYATGEFLIQKIDPSGNLVWEETYSDEFGVRALDIDDSGNIYTIGDDRIDFYAQKIDSMGVEIWVRKMENLTNLDESNRGHSIVVDDFGNIYIIGEFEETVDFDPGPDTLILNSFGNRDVFVQKLNNDGNLMWIKQMQGTWFDRGYSIALDTYGNIYTTGYFTYTVDFDPGPDSLNLTSFDCQDIFIQKLDPLGNLQWTKQIGGTKCDQGFFINVDQMNNIYVTGYFEDTVDFDPGLDSLILNSAGEEDIFILKFRGYTTNINNLKTDLGFIIYPNPTSNNVNIDKGNNQKIKILVYNNVGQLILSKISTDQYTSLDLSKISAGIYYIAISNGKSRTTQKIVKH